MEPPSSPPAAPEEATLGEKLLMGLGILLGLCGSIMINVGNNVQALGMGLDAAQQDLDVKERSKRPKVLWITGTVTFIVGSVINFVALPRVLEGREGGVVDRYGDSNLLSPPQKLSTHIRGCRSAVSGLEQ